MLPEQPAAGEESGKAGFLCNLFRSVQNFFENQSCSHPERRIVKANQTVYISFGITVVPRTEVMAFKKRTAHVFTGKDAGGINTSSTNRRQIFDKFVNRADNCRHTINGKHPDRSLSYQFSVVFAERTDRGEEDFHTPSGQSAD